MKIFTLLISFVFMFGLGWVCKDEGKFDVVVFMLVLYGLIFCLSINY